MIDCCARESRRLPGPLRVLVVDDNLDCGVRTRLVCRLWGHDVRQSSNGAGALRMLAVFFPDVFLLDLAMPAMSGFELARRLRRMPDSRESRLIAVSGFADQVRRLQAATAGFDAYLTRPLDLGRLQDLLREEAAACRQIASHQHVAVA